MTVTRVNILNNNSRRDQFIRGVKLLKDDILRPEWPNTYDLFVIWHYVAMNTFTPPSQNYFRNLSQIPHLEPDSAYLYRKA